MKQSSDRRREAGVRPPCSRSSVSVFVRATPYTGSHFASQRTRLAPGRGASPAWLPYTLPARREAPVVSGEASMVERFTESARRDSVRFITTSKWRMPIGYPR